MKFALAILCGAALTLGCDRGAQAVPAQPKTQTETAAVVPNTATLGQAAPNFTLKNTAGALVSLSQFKGKVVVLEWFNPDCPFVKLAHREGALGQTVTKHRADGGVWLGINSSASGLQGHGAARNASAIKELGLTYPVLLDEDGAIGRAYGAERTPHMYIIDAAGKLVYRGALDSTRGGGYDRGPFTAYLTEALAAVAQGQTPATANTKAWGCSVKYAR